MAPFKSVALESGLLAICITLSATWGRVEISSIRRATVSRTAAPGDANAVNCAMVGFLPIAR